MTWDRGGLKPGMLPGLLGYRLRLAQQAVFRDFAAACPTCRRVAPGCCC